MKRKILEIIKIIYKIALIAYTAFMTLVIVLPEPSYIPEQDRFISKIQTIGVVILTVPLIFFIGSMFGCFKKINIMRNIKLKGKLITTVVSILICFFLSGVMFTITSDNYSEEYKEITRQRILEEKNKKIADEKEKQEELTKQEEEKKKQEELAKQEEEKKKQEELAKQEEEKKKQEELAKQEEEKKKQEELAKQEEVVNNTPKFKSAIGNLYTGVTLYAEENGQMEPYFTVLDRGENVSNPGAEIIKNGVLVKEIPSGDTYWKDVDRMIKDSTSKEPYIIKYYVKSDDQYLP